MQEIQYILDDVDWTEETNDSGWDALNRIVQFLDPNNK